MWCCGGVLVIPAVLEALRNLKKRRYYQAGYLNVSQAASRECVSEPKFPELETLCVRDESLSSRAPQGQGGHEVIRGEVVGCGCFIPDRGLGEECQGREVTEWHGGGRLIP